MSQEKKIVSERQKKRNHTITIRGNKINYPRTALQTEQMKNKKKARNQ